MSRPATFLPPYSTMPICQVPSEAEHIKLFIPTGFRIRLVYYTEQRFPKPMTWLFSKSLYHVKKQSNTIKITLYGILNIPNQSN